jgi:hypothetical protein
MLALLVAPSADRTADAAPTANAPPAVNASKMTRQVFFSFAFHILVSLLFSVS